MWPGVLPYCPPAPLHSSPKKTSLDMKMGSGSLGPELSGITVAWSVMGSYCLGGSGGRGQRRKSSQPAVPGALETACRRLCSLGAMGTSQGGLDTASHPFLLWKFWGSRRSQDLQDGLPMYVGPWPWVGASGVGARSPEMARLGQGEGLCLSVLCPGTCAFLLQHPGYHPPHPLPPTTDSLTLLPEYTHAPGPCRVSGSSVRAETSVGFGAALSQPHVLPESDVQLTCMGPAPGLEGLGV